VGVFDAVVAKLSLEFVPDLSQLGAQFRALVRPGGTFVFSVQHPLLVIVSHPDEVIPYWDMKPFDVRVGSGGSTVTKIHRNLAQYLDPFLENGFSLVHVNEPEIPDNAAKAYQVDPKHFRVPKRLNVAFRLLDN
jgi:SAM-dependent methyltransferase